MEVGPALCLLPTSDSSRLPSSTVVLVLCPVSPFFPHLVPGRGSNYPALGKVKTDSQQGSCEFNGGQAWDEA